MKNIGDNHDLRSFNLISTLLSIINQNEENDSYAFLAKYILMHLRDLDEKSIYDLADECYVSRSSLQRFIKYIGFDSFANLKQKLPEVLVHSDRFLRYAQDAEFKKHYRESMLEMMDSIEALASSVHMEYFVDLIHISDRVVFSFAESSTLAPIDFQEAMAPHGKLIRCITNSTRSLELLNDLNENDTLITLSVTGNYALVALKDVEKVKANKVLFTLNHLDKFKEVYDKVIYLSDTDQSFNYIREGLRDAYTIQGFSYLFDLMLSRYLEKYGK